MPFGPEPMSIPEVPASSLASSMTCWPWSSAIAFWIDASTPGVRPANFAESVRSRLRRSTSASHLRDAIFWRRTGSSQPPARRTSSSRSSADGPAPQSEPADDNDTRSLASVTRARRQPSPSAPTSRSAGSRTSSKNTWLKECAVVGSMIGDIEMPGRSVGQMK